MFPAFWIWAYSFNRCVAVTHCRSVYFPGNMWCGPPFHMLISLCVFLVKCLLRFLAHCLTGLFVSLFFTFKSYCMFWITVLYQTCLLTCWFKLTNLVLLYLFFLIRPLDIKSHLLFFKKSFNFFKLWKYDNTATGDLDNTEQGYI